jgi:Ni/Co efflux regulator RcnB
MPKADAGSPRRCAGHRARETEALSGIPRIAGVAQPAETCRKRITSEEDVVMRGAGWVTAGIMALVMNHAAWSAPPPGKGKPEGTGHAASTPGPHDEARGSSGWDEQAFRLFVQEQHYSGYSSLPPGIRKKLARGQPLPPGIAKRELPPTLLQRLPVRAGYEWRAVGTDVVLYSIASGMVDQVLRDVFLD